MTTDLACLDREELRRPAADTPAWLNAHAPHKDPAHLAALSDRDLLATLCQRVPAHPANNCWHQIVTWTVPDPSSRHGRTLELEIGAQTKTAGGEPFQFLAVVHTRQRSGRNVSSLAPAAGTGLDGVLRELRRQHTAQFPGLSRLDRLEFCRLAAGQIPS